jgi:hypothetical protein
MRPQFPRNYGKLAVTIHAVINEDIKILISTARRTQKAHTFNVCISIDIRQKRFRIMSILDSYSENTVSNLTPETGYRDKSFVIFLNYSVKSWDIT